MRVYADTSFLVKLLVHESGTEEALAEYRRRGRPALFYLPIHALETETAIRGRAFHQRNAAASGDRARIKREEAAALTRLRLFTNRGLLIEAAADWDAACERARNLSQKHAGTTGARSLDLLHVAFALDLRSELFLTTDACQAKVASLEGLRVAVVRD